MDLKTTMQLYEKIDQKKRWEQQPEAFVLKYQEVWYDKVRSKRNGEFYQAQDLINRQLVPADWVCPHMDMKTGKPVIYPLIRVNCIIRRRIQDGSEWLTSRQDHIGLDESGNPINQSFVDPEAIDDILPIYTIKPENPKARDSKMIREITSIEHRTKYTLPFNSENLDKLWSMRYGNVALVLKDESKGDTKPYSIDNYEQFKTLEFDELWEMISTPIWKMDRSIKDQLNDAQYR